jgi:murein L,D-transpeptidase YcbB/YkuD
VHITYQTSWVDKDGTINFNNDTYARDDYARDEKLQAALSR